MNVGTPYTSGSTDITLERAKSTTVADAYNGAKITLGSETREITDYAESFSVGLEDGLGSIVLDSTDGVLDADDDVLLEFGGATLNLSFSTSADISNTVTLNFSTREIEALAIANSTNGIANTPSMDIDLSSKVNVNDRASNTTLFDTDLNT